MCAGDGVASVKRSGIGFQPMILLQFIGRMPMPRYPPTSGVLTRKEAVVWPRANRNWHRRGARTCAVVRK